MGMSKNSPFALAVTGILRVVAGSPDPPWRTTPYTATYSGIAGRISFPKSRSPWKGLHGIPPEILSGLRRKLNVIAFAENVQDLRVPPSNHLERLKGDRAGFWSIRVNSQWRLVFRWDANKAVDLQLVDYH